MPTPTGRITPTPDNRLLAQELPAAGTTSRWKHAPNGNQVSGRAVDRAGRPAEDEARRYVWDAEGRLANVTARGATTAYRYNHLGLRIAKKNDRVEQHYLYDGERQRVAELDAQGRITRQYIWLAGELVAVIDMTRPADLRTPAEGWFGRMLQTLREAWAGVSRGSPAMSYVHVDHLGTPVAMTDPSGKPVWSAHYAPFGRRFAAAVSVVGSRHPGDAGMRLDLRLPGQWEDEESGLYYNDHRYYDPDAGRYISPDPLGLDGGLNAFAYVGNNPLGFSDPLGLVLFAFDGTGNTNDRDWLRANRSSFSNVWQFRQLYDDGSRHYITGVGTIDRSDPARPINPSHFVPGKPILTDVEEDMGGNYSGPARIDRMIEYFDEEANATVDDTAMDVDIIGFSRGAAQAREFANRIVAGTRGGYYRYTATRSDGTREPRCQKVNFRFMGLWDTVLSTNMSSLPRYNLAIPEAFAHVAHATALNEYRSELKHPRGSWGAFPLESIMPGRTVPAPVPGRTRIERGFLGAHADIGGGYPEGEQQLAEVALAWMVKQANAAGVKMRPGPTSMIANPVVHDMSDAILYGLPRRTEEDRSILFADGARSRMRTTRFPYGMSYADTTRFIRYLPIDDPARRRHVTGTVDMKGYLKWLNDHGYGLTDLSVH